MSPSQITPLEVAANQLNDIKNSQQHAMQTAMALAERVPFAPQGIDIVQIRRNFRFQWGVRMHVSRGDVQSFPQIAAELGAIQQPDLHNVGIGEVAQYETLIGSLAGVPFEIRAYIGSQRVQVVAA